VNRPAVRHDARRDGRASGYHARQAYKARNEADASRNPEYWAQFWEPRTDRPLPEIEAPERADFDGSAEYCVAMMEYGYKLIRRGLKEHGAKLVAAGVAGLLMLPSLAPVKAQYAGAPYDLKKVDDCTLKVTHNDGAIEPGEKVFPNQGFEVMKDWCPAQSGSLKAGNDSFAYIQHFSGLSGVKAVKEGNDSYLEIPAQDPKNTEQLLMRDNIVFKFWGQGDRLYGPLVTDIAANGTLGIEGGGLDILGEHFTISRANYNRSDEVLDLLLSGPDSGSFGFLFRYSNCSVPGSMVMHNGMLLTSKEGISASGSLEYDVDGDRLSINEFDYLYRNLDNITIKAHSSLRQSLKDPSILLGSGWDVRFEGFTNCSGKESALIYLVRNGSQPVEWLVCPSPSRPLSYTTELAMLGVSAASVAGGLAFARLRRRRLSGLGGAGANGSALPQSVVAEREQAARIAEGKMPDGWEQVETDGTATIMRPIYNGKH
jgi:hypothetical protein